MTRSKPPCYNNGKDCDERRVGCRSTCSRWKEYEQIHQQNAEAIRKKKMEEHVATEFLIKREERNRVYVVEKYDANRRGR